MDDWNTCGGCESLSLSGSGHFACNDPRISKLLVSKDTPACRYFSPPQLKRAMDWEGMIFCLISHGIADRIRRGEALTPDQQSIKDLSPVHPRSGRLKG